MAEGTYIGLTRLAPRHPTAAERIEHGGTLCRLAHALDYSYCWLCGAYGDDRVIERPRECVNRDPIRGGLIT